MDTSEYVECCRTLARFARALDQGDFDTVVLQMTDDGLWHRQGELLEGRKTILAALVRRPQTRLTRHLITNVVGDLVSPGQARLQSTVLTYATDSASSFPVEMRLPKSILDYEDILERQPTGTWLISERRSRRIFADPS